MLFVLRNYILVEVEVFWVVTPCSVMVGHQRFGGLCWLHLYGEMMYLLGYAFCGT
jgi:hypothetical protein